MSLSSGREADMIPTDKAVSRIEEDLGTSISYSTGAAAGALWFAIWVQL